MQRLSMFVAFFVLLLAAPAFALPSDVISGNPSVKAVKSHGNTVITFKGRHGEQLFSQIAGREINLSCHPAQLDPASPGDSSDTDDFVAPKRERKLRAVLEGDWCEVVLVHKHKPPRQIVAVALNPEGAAFLNERSYAVVVDHLVTGASIEATSGRYPTAGQFLPHQRPGIVALANPTEPVPPGKSGFYSDGARHIEAVGVTPAGKRLFEDINGDTVSSNVLGYVASLDF